MDFNLLINKNFITKDNKKGIVISIDDVNIIVNVNGETKTYKTRIVFSNKYFIFEDNNLNEVINNWIDGEHNKEENKKHEIEQINKETISVYKNNKEQYEIYRKRNITYQKFFGYLFPYKKFARFTKRSVQNLPPTSHDYLVAYFERRESIFQQIIKGIMKDE